MRKAFTLTEMLAAIFILAVLMLVLAKPMRNLTVEIPRISRDFETNSRMLDCVNRLRKDIEGCTDLQVYPADENVGGELLMIGSGDSMICYQFAKGTIVRYRMAGASSQVNNDEYVWNIPHGRIGWQIWHDSGKTVAIEVTTAVARKIAGKVRDRLKNSYVLFLRANDMTEGQI